MAKQKDVLRVTTGKSDVDGTQSIVYSDVGLSQSNIFESPAADRDVQLSRMSVYL